MNASFYLLKFTGLYECHFSSSNEAFKRYVIILTETLFPQYFCLGSPTSQIILKYCSIIHLGGGQGFWTSDDIDAFSNLIEVTEFYRKKEPHN